MVILQLIRIMVGTFRDLAKLICKILININIERFSDIRSIMTPRSCVTPETIGEYGSILSRVLEN